MAQIPLEVVLTVTGGREVKRALRGITKDTERAEKDVRREIKKTEREREQGVDRQRSVMRRMGDAWRRFERERRTESRRTARELENNQVSAVRRAVQRTRDIIRRNRAELIGAGLFGVAGGIRSGVSRARQISGLVDPIQQVQSAKQFQLRIAQLQTAGKLTDQQSTQLREAILSAARGRTVSAGNILGGAESVVRLVGGEAIPDFIAGLKTAANFSEGFGADMQGLSILALQLQQQFDISKNELDEAFGTVAQSALEGSVEFENFAQQFPAVMSVYTNTIKQKGIPALLDFASAAQAVGFQFPGDAETTRTYLRRLLLQIGGDPGTQKILQRRVLGGKTIQEAGLRGLAEGLSRADLSAAQYKAIFKDGRAIQAAQALANRPEVFARIASQNPADAVALAATGAQRVRGTQAGRDIIQANKTFESVVEGFDGVANAARDFTSMLDDFTAKNLGLTQTLGIAFDALQAAGIGAIGVKLLKGSSALGEGADALSSSASNTSKAVGFLGKAALVAGTAVLAFQGAKYAEEKLGISNRLLDAAGVPIAGVDPSLLSTGPGVSAPTRGGRGLPFVVPQGGAPAPPEMLRRNADQMETTRTQKLAADTLLRAALELQRITGIDSGNAGISQ